MVSNSAYATRRFDGLAVFCKAKSCSPRFLEVWLAASGFALLDRALFQRVSERIRCVCAPSEYAWRDRRKKRKSWCSSSQCTRTRLTGLCGKHQGCHNFCHWRSHLIMS
eukprot:6359585-Amphidinium_carterae.1